MTNNGSIKTFVDKLIFGFDIGTGSIGYAVRKGTEFKDVGVLICPNETNDLSGRRSLRRKRRTLRSRETRRNWFAKELEILGLFKPAQPLHDPISLRLRALNGGALRPAELHTALTHLFMRRGYSKVPWANSEIQGKQGDTKTKEEGIIKEAVAEITKKLNAVHPCQYFAERHKEVGKSPSENWARKIYWPRECLELEFRAILKAQEKNFPNLSPKADWLLYGDTPSKRKHGVTYHVFFNAKGSRNPGTLGMHWPRFDNRKTALDSFLPVDREGRPLHIARKNKEAYSQAQRVHV